MKDIVLIFIGIGCMGLSALAIRELIKDYKSIKRSKEFRKRATKLEHKLKRCETLEDLKEVRKEVDTLLHEFDLFKKWNT